MRLGVIDVGTNSVRLLVADGALGQELAEVERHLVITRLGEGVDRARALAAAPLRRTVAAVAAYAESCRLAGADRVRIIATSAVRDASNRAEFLNAVLAATGSEVEVLSGEQEARLGFLGATNELRAVDVGTPPPFLVVDVGGGSTELVWGTADAERWISLDIGSVRMTERHVSSDPPSGAALEAIRANVDTALFDAVEAIGDGPVGTLVGLAGTITTVTAVALGLDGYERARIHHARLGTGEIESVRDRLASMTSTQRRDVPAMPRGREDVIIGGILILERVMTRFGVETCLVSESDILDGAALDLLVQSGR